MFMGLWSMRILLLLGGKWGSVVGKRKVMESTQMLYIHISQSMENSKGERRHRCSQGVSILK